MHGFANATKMSLRLPEHHALHGYLAQSSRFLIGLLSLNKCTVATYSYCERERVIFTVFNSSQLHQEW